MLKSLSIKNYALIEQLEIDFDKGLSVISGETGAGKSILLGALALVLGQRADSKSIRDGASKCIIEAVFDIREYCLERFFAEHEWEYDSTECTLRREILLSGKSRSFLNDSPVSLNDLKLLGEKLIDIHSQHRNLLLGDTLFQLQVLDNLAGHAELLADYHACFQEYQRLEWELRHLKSEQEQNKREEDYLRFQFNQLKDLNLQQEEQQMLEVELEMLSHAEEIKETLYRADTLLTGESNSLLSVLKEMINSFRKTSKVFSRLNELTERLDSIDIELKDISSEIQSLDDGVEYNPERLLWVQERLNVIYSLEQKHHVNNSDQLLQLQNELEKQLGSIDEYEDKINAKEQQVETLKQQLLKKADVLSVGRKKAAKDSETALVKRLAVLGMPNANFSCEITVADELHDTGRDKITFLFAANKNQRLRPVADIASGGEISRLMLSIKALIAGKTALPTIIFDEIDMGVSGEIADKMGQIMKEMSGYMQVITITHLPQIAAKGDQHYFVYKEDNERETLTKLKRLTMQERIRELARLLSGSTLSEAALANARELLQKA
ncbi:MAG: DNA repair protein RecN [Bacteroidales bacterium]|nr:DNA repair protein RecN [Bacteroidales bacterium]